MLVGIRVGDEMDGALEHMGVTEIYGGDAADSVRGSRVRGEPAVKGKACEDAELVEGINTIDVRRGIGRGVAGLMRLAERFIKAEAVALHLGEDVIRGAVKDAVDSVQAVSGHAVGDGADDRHASGNGGLYADRNIFLRGERLDLVSVFGQQVLVRSHDRLATFQRAQDNLTRSDGASHGLDDKINVRVMDDLLPVFNVMHTWW